MRFLKNIFNKISNWSSNFHKKKVVYKPTTISKKKNTVDEITLEQKKVRKEVINETKGKTNRVTRLSPKQEKLIAKKHNIQNRKAQNLSVFNLNELSYELELLNTNLELQKTQELKISTISSESISCLKKKIIKKTTPQINIAQTLLENRKNIKNFRESDKKSIDKKRQNIFNFSLIELFKEREKVKELARIEAQKKEDKRIQNLKFDEAIKKAKKLIKNYDFDIAETELKNALSINNLRHKVVSDLRNEISRLKFHFEKQQAKFKEVFNKAMNQMHNIDYESALNNFNLSKLYNINSIEVDEKIKLVKSYILSRKINEENFIKQKDSFLLDINSKNFIEAKTTLTSIIENFDNKEAEIENLHKLYDEEKLSHEKVEEIYKKKIEKAENLYLNKNFEEAIRLFKVCLSLNIDNKFCENRIKEINHNEKLEAQKKKLVDKKRALEKQSLAELNKYKKEKEEILQFLKSKGIKSFYHFTDESNINSIKLNGGLYSWMFCDNNNIEINKPGGDNTSRNLDIRYNLENFVRLSIAKEHPMQYVALRDNRLRSIRNLEIDIQTAVFKNTLFSNMNATRNGHLIGNNLSFLKNEIKYNVIKQSKYYNLSLEDKPYYQAEIMVKEHIESKYITNL